MEIGKRLSNVPKPDSKTFNSALAFIGMFTFSECVLVHYPSQRKKVMALGRLTQLREVWNGKSWAGTEPL